MACDAVSFRWSAPLAVQKLLDSKTVEVVPAKSTQANDAAVTISLAIDTGERSTSRPDGVPQHTNTAVGIKA
jgi:hypothetical protein